MNQETKGSRYTTLAKIDPKQRAVGKQPQQWPRVKAVSLRGRFPAFSWEIPSFRVGPAGFCPK